MRLVLDTNVLVSGLLQPLGPSGQIARLVAGGDLEVAIVADTRCLVTGYARHYPPKARQSIEVVAPRAFVEPYRAEQD